jgi:Cd2+/Zn2+-exporting ATPase
MLSGDNRRTVNGIARQVGLDEARGDLLPKQKVERVRELMARHKHVGMIGDGVNDAPAMAVSSVGIAMGAAGTDAAIETADMALMQDNLSKVADAIRLGHRTVRVFQANIAFALGMKAIFLALAPPHEPLARDPGRHRRDAGRPRQRVKIAAEQDRTASGKKLGWLRRRG